MWLSVPERVMSGLAGQTVRMNEVEITPIHVGGSGFIAAICRDLRIAEMINRSVRWDEKQWKVSPGTRAVALIINILMARRPLYRVWESFERLDLPVLFDEPVELDDLNDDGRRKHGTVRVGR